MIRALVVTLFLASGCAAAESPIPMHDGPALPTLDPPDVAGEECPQALLGPVTLEERLDSAQTPVVAIVPNGDVVGLVWARGFVADFQPLVIRDPSGEPVAEGGDQVWLTGGSTADERFFVCDVSTSMP